MKPPPFDYYCPSSRGEALDLLCTLENSKILAGGQSLVPMLNMRYVSPDSLVDINKIPDLDGVRVENTHVTIGATTRQRTMETSEALFAAAPIFREALAHVGHRQTRNRGTFGGSLCHLDSAAELPVLALLYEAELTVESAGGARKVGVSDFILDQMTPALEEGELLAAAQFRAWSAGSGFCFLEHARRRGDFALGCAAALIETNADGDIECASVAIGGVCAIPLRLRSAERLLTGRRGDPELFRFAARDCENLPALSDIHASGDFRRAIGATLVRRAVAAAYRRAMSHRAQRRD